MVQPHDDDPGWFTPTDLLLSFVPIIGMRHALNGGRNFLQLLRLVFVTFANAIILIGVVALYLAGGDDGSESMSSGLAAGMVIAVGVMGLAGSIVVSPPLNCSSPETLLGSYRTRFFLRLAFAEVAALVGFVGVILTGEWWLYPLGAAFTLIGFVRLAPTEKNLLKDQETLNSQGCGQSLRGLMLSAGPAPGPSSQSD